MADLWSTKLTVPGHAGPACCRTPRCPIRCQADRGRFLLNVVVRTGTGSAPVPDRSPAVACGADRTRLPVLR